MRIESFGSVKIYWPDLNRDELIARLRDQAKALQDRLPMQRLFLFGSWAKAQATAFSDVDVLAVYKGPPREDAYRLVWDTLRVEGLEPHVYSESEAASVASVIDDWATEGVDLLS